MIDHASSKVNVGLFLLYYVTFDHIMALVGPPSHGMRRCSKMRSEQEKLYTPSQFFVVFFVSGASMLVVVCFLKCCF